MNSKLINPEYPLAYAESPGSKMMKGLLLLRNTTEEQWQAAMEARKENTAVQGKEFSDIRVLTHIGEFSDEQ